MWNAKHTTKPRRSRPTRLHVEALEDRTAPATLVSPTTITYKDADSDHVRVTFSKPILTAANVNSVFTFDAGTVDGVNDSPQQLRAINLSGNVAAAGTSIKVSADRVLGGDGFAAVGHINAAGMDLGAVTVDGDLGRIAAGDDTMATSALKRLTVHSIGRFGLTTGAPEMFTQIFGALGVLHVKTDVTRASIRVLGGPPDAGIGRVFIGGSLIGGSENSIGHIFSSGNMQKVTVRGDLVGGIGYDTGMIWSLAGLERVTVGGSLQGGAGYGSGGIFAEGYVGHVTVHGNLKGGSGEESGSVRSLGSVVRVAVGGAAEGGSGKYSGSIHSAGALGPVTIVRDLTGGDGMESGAVRSSAGLAGAVIGGSVKGGAGGNSGRIQSLGDMGPVTIRRDLGSTASAAIAAVFSNGKLARVTIGGSVIGSRIYSSGDLGLVTIRGNLIGGNGVDSGSVRSTAKLAGVRIGGSVMGGGGTHTGSIWANKEAGTIVIGGDLVGGSATFYQNLLYSGAIGAKRIARVVLGGSLIAGTDSTTGIFSNNGAICVDDDLGAVLIKGNVTGNPTNPAIISARGQAAPPTMDDVAIASLRILGQINYGRILAGYNQHGTGVNADAQIRAVTVGGDWIASSLVAGAMPGLKPFFGNNDDAMIAGTDVKDEDPVFSRIGLVTIGGVALGSSSVFDHFGIVAEEVGSVKVAGKPLPLKPGMSNDDIRVGDTNDFKVNEI